MPEADDRAEILRHARAAFLAGFSRVGADVPLDTLAPLITEELLCPWPARIPAGTLERIRGFVGAIYRMRMSAGYQATLAPELEKRALTPKSHHSLFMSYDFHLRGDGTPALIEVNTNASFYGLGFPLHTAMGLEPLTPPATLRADILREVAAATGSAREPLKVVITDEKPTEQKLYAEFLFYQSLFRSWGWHCEIVDVHEVPDDADWIYNRHTDFYLETPATAKLRAAYRGTRTCVSPGPNEYLFLADKQRMIDWNTPGNLDAWKVPAADQEIIRTVLPKAYELSPANAEEIWKERKSLFFKAKRSFGSKQSYKGASVSRRMFDELISQDVIAQEYVHAPELTFPGVTDLGAFKYDLRVYADRDEVRGAVARFYQGQVTNTRTPFGGFAPVIFE